MKKLLSLLAITSLSITISDNVTSCFLFPKKDKGSSYQDVFNKINDKTTDLKWTDDAIDNGNDQTSLKKESEDKKPDSWVSMLGNVFGLTTSDELTKDEMKYIINITDNQDDLLDNGKAEKVTISLSKFPTNPNPSISDEIERTVTWSSGSPPASEIVQNTINDINESTDIKALGTTLDTDASNSETTSAILNDINLPEEEKSLVTISGTLNEDRTASLTFKVKKNDVEDSTTKDVYFYKNTYSTNQKYFYDVCEYDGTYYAGDSGSNEIYTLTNNDFTKDSTLLSNVETNTFYVYNDILYASTTSGFYEYKKGAASFEKIDNFSTKTFISYSYNNEIYLGTTSGLYKLDSSGSINKIGTSSPTIYGLASYNNKLYIGTTSGLYKLNNTGDDIEIVSSNTDDEHSLVSYNNKLYIGTDNGLYKLNDTEDDIEPVDNTVSSIYTVIVYNNHLYAGGRSSHGLYELDSSGTSLKKVVSRSYETAISLVNNTLFLHGSYISDTQTYGIEFYYSTD